MTARQPCPRAPGPLEEYTAEFDALFSTLGQRRSVREYLTGLLLPRDRNKTLTALAGAEPVVEAQAAAVQRLQYLLSEADWEAALVTARRIALLKADRFTAPHAAGVLVIDDTGDRKDGSATAHVARQYLGSVGKVDTGIVAVTSLWADRRCYYPLHVEPYTPAARLAKGKRDPAFRTKPVIAHDLIDQARAAGIPFRAVVADSFYGENGELEATLVHEAVPYVLGRKAHLGHWASAEAAHTFHDAARALRRSAWTKVVRRFTDGHRATWWAAELTFAGYRPGGRVRAVVATTDRVALPPLSTWYLTSNLARQDAPLAELVRLYGLRVWVEEGYKRVKHELGWADFQVRSDRAIRRHWALVCCAFSFCWWHEGRATPPAPSTDTEAARGKNQRREPSRERSSPRRRPALAGRAPPRARVARPVAMAHALLAGVVAGAPATGARYTHQRASGRATGSISISDVNKLPLGGAALTASAAWWLRQQRVLFRVPFHGQVLRVRARDLAETQFVPIERGEAWSLRLSHGDGASRLEGEQAVSVMTKVLARLDGWGAGASTVDQAVARLDVFGTRARMFAFMARTAEFEALPEHPGVLARLPAGQRLALEMVVHEEAEERALQGELEALELAWREAEAVARIADDLFVPPAVTEWLARYHARSGGPSGSG